MSPDEIMREEFHEQEFHEHEAKELHDAGYTLDVAHVISELEKTICLEFYATAYRWVVSWLSTCFRNESTDCFNEIWDWFKRRCESGDAEERIIIFISVFEPMLEESEVNIGLWKEQIFELIANPETRWVFVYAYNNRKELFFSDFEMYACPRVSDLEKRYALRYEWHDEK